MNTFIKKIIQSAIFLGFMQIVTVQASLLISPTNVALTDRERSAKVIIINTGTVTRNYRISWSEKKARSTGGYDILSEEDQKTFPIASSMVRVSPKQVKLAPGERQTIKLSARRPKDLPDGDYRSHLLFTALPNQSEVPQNNAAGVTEIKVLLGYSIPFIVRKGDEKYNVSIDNAKLIPREDQTKKIKNNVSITLSSIGSTTPSGVIHAYWRKNKSTEEVHVATLNSARIYPELDEVKFTLYWHKGVIEPKSGQLRLVYTGVKEFAGVTFAEKTINIH